jgi:hypothetical protein
MNETEESFVEGLQEIIPARVQHAFEVPKLSRVCAGCQNSAREGKDRVCRFEPPKVFMFMVPTMSRPLPGLAPQQGFQITTQTAFPVVRDDQWCSKFHARGP